MRVEKRDEAGRRVGWHLVAFFGLTACGAAMMWINYAQVVNLGVWLPFVPWLICLGLMARLALRGPR